MTLTLVPIGDHWINPEEIAAIVSDDHDRTKCHLVLKGRDAAIYVNQPADFVVDRLRHHDSGVASLAEAAQYLSAHVSAVVDTQSDNSNARFWKRTVGHVDSALKSMGLYKE